MFKKFTIFLLLVYFSFILPLLCYAVPKEWIPALIISDFPLMMLMTNLIRKMDHE